VPIQTRSGVVFSPWALGAPKRTIIPLCPEDFDFEHLVFNAVVKESELDDDDAEGSALDPVTTPPLLPSSSLDMPLSICNLYGQHSQPGPSNSSAPPRNEPKIPHGSAEDILCKKRDKAKRAVQRLQEKCAAPYGSYAVKPRVLNCHVRPATAVKTKLEAWKLKHTKNGWTDARDQGGYRQVFTLDETVGENSRFKFGLDHWDGR
jgi:hypothetical protein